MRHGAIVGPACVAAVLCAIALPALSQTKQRLIEFERDAPEIQAFRKKNPGGESMVGGTKAPSLALPVLDFTYPAVVGLGGFESAPASSRTPPVYDPRNPTTYSVSHSYGDVTIVVTADLNIQAEANSRSRTGRGIRVETSNGGEPGVARVTLYKFGIPYTLDVECGRAHEKLCRDREQLRALATRLTLVSVPKR